MTRQVNSYLDFLLNLTGRWWQQPFRTIGPIDNLTDRLPIIRVTLPIVHQAHALLMTQDSVVNVIENRHRVITLFGFDMGEKDLKLFTAMIRLMETLWNRVSGQEVCGRLKQLDLDNELFFAYTIHVTVADKLFLRFEQQAYKLRLLTDIEDSEEFIEYSYHHIIGPFRVRRCIRHWKHQTLLCKSLRVLRRHIMHWALRPDGPIAKVALRDFDDNRSCNSVSNALTGQNRWNCSSSQVSNIL